MAKEKRQLRFVQLDVFTSRPFEGNSLAVVLDGRGLSDEEMQALAREMNLSETTFIFPREPSVERVRGIRVRIFTVQEELPFAGHPTLGTGFQLRGSTGAPEIVLDLNAGKVPVRFEEKAGQPALLNANDILEAARYESSNLPDPILPGSNQTMPTQEKGERKRVPSIAG